MKVVQCERLTFCRRGLSEKTEKALGSNPFPGAESETRTPHLDFLASAPSNASMPSQRVESYREPLVIRDGEPVRSVAA